MSAVVVLLVIAGIALVGFIIFGAVWANRKRRQALAAWAAKRQFSEYDASMDLGFLTSFQAYGPGYGHRNFDGYQGSINGVAVRAFQHQSRTKSKDSENIHNFTVVKMEMPYAGPDLVLKREGLHHKLFDALGGEDIDFESDEFSRKFWVKCKDRKFAYAVIHPRMMDMLLEAPRMTLQWQGQHMVLHVSGAFHPDKAEPLIELGLAFRALLPKHLHS
ncbi:MAG: hypothetical protein ACPHK8_01655 [Thermoplasmatota archaeon]